MPGSSTGIRDIVPSAAETSRSAAGPTVQNASKFARGTFDAGSGRETGDPALSLMAAVRDAWALGMSILRTMAQQTGGATARMVMKRWLNLALRPRHHAPATFGKEGIFPPC